MDNFNLRKYLVENKVTTNSRMLKEDYGKATIEHITRYWEAMVEQQPEDVTEILVKLTSGTLSFHDFIRNTEDDILDSFRDELYNDEDDDYMSETKGLKEDVKIMDGESIDTLKVGGKEYTVGEYDPNDDGEIVDIQKYPNGYFVTGTVFGDDDGDRYEKEGYGYAIDLDGNEMEEDDLEGRFA